MWPTISSLRTYMVFYGLSMVVQMWLSVRLCRRRGVTWKAGVALGLGYFWGMCVGAKILYDLLNSRFDWHNYLDIGYYFGLGAWGGPLAYLAVAVTGVLLFARDRRVMLYVVVLTLPVPMVLAKSGWFVNGCCYGTVSSLPWAMPLAEGAQGPAGIPRHPTPLYEILVLIVIAIVFARLDAQRWKGTFVLLFVLLYGIGRPLSELWRATDELRMPLGPFSASPLTCLPAPLVAGVPLLFLLRPPHPALPPPTAARVV